MDETVIKSLVDNILMPPIGYLTGKVDFSTLSAKLPVPDGEPVEIKFGLFLYAMIQPTHRCFCTFRGGQGHESRAGPI